MKGLSCEKVLMALMARADGESAELSAEEIREHSSACQNCRDEVVRIQPVIDMLQQATRAEQTVDLWPAVSSRLERQAPRMSWTPFVFVGALLLAYKLLEMLPAEEPGWAMTLVPLIIFAALLVFLKENPFRINSELVLEK